MRLIVAGQVPTAPADRELFFQDVSLLLQSLLGLAVGEDQVRANNSCQFCCGSAESFSPYDSFSLLYTRLGGAIGGRSRAHDDQFLRKTVCNSCN